MSNLSALSLYRQLLRTSRRFVDFNIQSYALRTTRMRFEEARGADPASAKELLELGHDQLGAVKRQASISQLYSFSSQPLVVEDYLRQQTKPLST